MDKIPVIKDLSRYLKKQGKKNLIEKMKQQIFNAQTDAEVKRLEYHWRGVRNG